jgi:hypothetical protein
MPQAYPLPKKYLSMLEGVQQDLRCMAQRARMALGEVEADEAPFELTRVILRDIEAIAYRIALDLAQMEVAGACDGCPSAPPTTQAEVILLVTATELERLAATARTHTTRGGRQLSGVSLQPSAVAEEALPAHPHNGQVRMLSPKEVR